VQVDQALVDPALQQCNVFELLHHCLD
jgi:hypothetical protein